MTFKVKFCYNLDLDIVILGNFRRPIISVQTFLTPSNAEREREERETLVEF